MNDDRWFALMEGLDEAVIVLDPQGTIKTWNLSFRKLLGIDGSQVPTGLKFDSILEQAFSVMPVLEELSNSSKRFWSGAVAVRRNDRSSEMVKCRIQGFRDGVGDVTGFYVIIREIDDFSRHAERLRMFEQAVAQSLEPVLITEAEPIDSPGPRIVYANEAFTRVTGYTLEEVVGKTPRILQGPASDRGELDRIRQALSAWKPVRAELINYRKDQTQFWVELVIFPVADETGWYTHWVAVQRDWTERKQLEMSLKAAREEAEHANQAKTAFLANMSHEIRTPLTAILGYSEMLLEPGTQKDPHDKCVRAIQRNGTHLLEIVGNVLDLSRIEVGKYKLDFAPFSPRLLTEDVITSHLLEAREKGLSLTVLIDETVPEQCVSDSASLRQILTNLVSNAIKFTEPGGHVRIEIHVESTAEPQLVFAVIDDGIGIAGDQIERLFEPFEQGDNSKSRKYGGVGLGLNICRQLTSLLNGSITVTSIPGQFTRFEIKIPYPATQESAGDPLRTARTVSVDSGSKSPQLQGKLLIVDDNPDNRQIIGYFLKKTGLVLDFAIDGRDAIEHVVAGDFSAIVLDMQMPEMDGYTAAAELRRMGYRIPIIALTANALVDDRRRCIAAGCTDYLAKPVSMVELHTLLARYLPPAIDRQPVP
jgi:PAS domain S-box-containing protein